MSRSALIRGTVRAAATGGMVLINTVAIAIVLATATAALWWTATQAHQQIPLAAIVPMAVITAIAVVATDQLTETLLPRPLQWLNERRGKTTASVPAQQAGEVKLGDTDAHPLPYNDPYFGLLHSLYALQHDIQRAESLGQALHTFTGARVMRTIDQLVVELEVRYAKDRTEAGQDPEDGPVVHDLAAAREHLRRACDALHTADMRFCQFEDEPEALDA